jgi:hypothetical protein
MALGASFYLLDTLEVPFCTLEMLQVCFKCVKKVKRSLKEPQGQLCFSDVVHALLLAALSTPLLELTPAICAKDLLQTQPTQSYFPGPKSKTLFSPLMF